MCMIMRNNELVESSAYPYGEGDASASISIDALELSGDLDSSVDLAEEPVKNVLVFSLHGISLGFGPDPSGAKGEVCMVE
ncbi:hypothetical protein AYI68_g5008 [Smittium mucronatum]|uniref:Uncharacterized protein n=1 Tax=Smittium mucronatum TaxID=133383 RepID=A0A1R0GVI4_9FUNG|nr:hypothetical protein AYI68_g5008 [Smittium mucronatum]